MVRRHDDEVEVRLGRIGEGVTGLVHEPGELAEGPSFFLWRGRIWRVLRVQARWLESAAWWEGPGVRAARGDWEPEEQFDSFLPVGAGVGGGTSGHGGRGSRAATTEGLSGGARGVAGGSSPLGDGAVARSGRGSRAATTAGLSGGARGVAGGSSPLGDGAAARSGRGSRAATTEGLSGGARGVAGGSSPLGNELEEFEVWRVEAASGQFFSRGVYELVHATGAGTWRMRAVVD